MRGFKNCNLCAGTGRIECMVAGEMKGFSCPKCLKKRSDKKIMHLKSRIKHYKRPAKLDPYPDAE